MAHKDKNEQYVKFLVNVELERQEREEEASENKRNDDPFQSYLQQNRIRTNNMIEEIDKSINTVSIEDGLSCEREKVKIMEYHQKNTPYAKRVETTKMLLHWTKEDSERGYCWERIGNEESAKRQVNFKTYQKLYNEIYQKHKSNKSIGFWKRVYNFLRTSS